ARDHRELDVQQTVEVALADLPVDRVHTRRLDADHDAVGPRVRCGDVAEFEDVGLAVTGVGDGSHIRGNGRSAVGYSCRLRTQPSSGTSTGRRRRVRAPASRWV